MAVTAGTRSFWSTLLSVLLKCIAALRFAPAARTTAAAPATTVPAPAAPFTAPAAGIGTFGTRAVPEPRLPYLPCLPQQSRRRSRTLPPTMKQRICAEAHGSSPSVRSLSGDGLLDDGRYTGSVTIGAPPA